MTIVTADPASARSLRNRAKLSNTKLPLKVTRLPVGSQTTFAPASINIRTKPTLDAFGSSLAAEHPDHQQQHGADDEHNFRQGGQQRGDFDGVAHRRFRAMVNAPRGRQSWPLRLRARNSREAAQPKPPRVRSPASGRCRTESSRRPTDQA